MLGGADNPNGELPSYITGANTNDFRIGNNPFNQPHTSFGHGEYKRLRSRTFDIENDSGDSLNVAGVPVLLA
ncbi:hypothetical protein BW691_05815 [Escherichia coli]|nr:hypothetical protein BW691_05815 [Escherichia coli]